MNLTSFLKTGTYLSLKIGSHEKDVYSIFSKKTWDRNFILIIKISMKGFRIFMMH